MASPPPGELPPLPKGKKARGETRAKT